MPIPARVPGSVQGHDSFPCAINTSIVDFWGRPKPAALALREIFTTPAAELR